MFSAGLDLAVVNGGDDSALARLMANARDLYCDLLETQVPVVAACTGHAIAGGAMLLLCSDYRVGQSGHAKIGLSEVSTGIALPQFGCDLAARRLARGFHLRATALAEVFDPPTAREAGFLDQVIEVEVVSASIECAIGLVSRLDGGAFATTKARVLRSFLDSHATARQVQMTESLSR
jgi:enoyl-CoA hydratase